ncbi:uncharacterized protein PAS_FragB_0076 [Komagataella phaffii GS115]|uniref:Uncharacterized protein n=2 Tax=Komagataella phaffii TaxID=460519 RepID=C4QZ98_KOMPG|nr:uncharacterized protein PAS_FragB_0076 [Komagataella phaffii GS115]CAY68572.1 hypothetical protein PAS_FragB_0076 [Komagataella phaffii GS115]
MPTTILRCPFSSCRSRIIKTDDENTNIKTVTGNGGPRLLQFSDGEVSLNSSTENLKFYQVNDMWTFDNIGVSKPTSMDDEFSITIDGGSVPVHIERYLTCADCDKGPIGIAGSVNKEALEDPSGSKLMYYLYTGSVFQEVSPSPIDT